MITQWGGEDGKYKVLKMGINMAKTRCRNRIINSYCGIEEQPEGSLYKGFGNKTSITIRMPFPI